MSRSKFRLDGTTPRRDKFVVYYTTRERVLIRRVVEDLQISISDWIRRVTLQHPDFIQADKKYGPHLVEEVSNPALFGAGAGRTGLGEGSRNKGEPIFGDDNFNRRWAESNSKPNPDPLPPTLSNNPGKSFDLTKNGHINNTNDGDDNEDE